MKSISVNLEWQQITDENSEDWQSTFCLYMYYFRSEPYLIGETHSNDVNVRKRYWEHENKDGTNKWIREDILHKYHTTSDFGIKVGVPFYGDSNRRVSDKKLIQEMEWILFGTELDREFCRANIRNTKSFTATRDVNIRMTNLLDYSPLGPTYSFDLRERIYTKN